MNEADSLGPDTEGASAEEKFTRLTRRIEQLERAARVARNAARRQLTITAAVSITAFMLASISICFKNSSIISADTIYAEKIYVRKGYGSSYCTIQHDAINATSISFFNNGAQLLTLGVNDRGNPRMDFLDNHGNVRMRAGLEIERLESQKGPAFESEKVASFILLYGSDKMPGCIFSLSNDDGPSLRLNDKDGHFIAALEMEAHGKPGLWIRDIKGERSVHAGFGATTGGIAVLKGSEPILTLEK